MKRVEIAYNGIANELDKLNARHEKALQTLAKKQAAAEKIGVADMDNAAHAAWIAKVPKTEFGFLTDKNDIKKNGAWFDLVTARRRVEEIEGMIENAAKRFAKAEEAQASYYEELEKVADLKKKEELWKLEFEQEQKEWAKDGITLKGRYYGTTPGGKKFGIERNHGFTERSLHCFTLWIDGEMIFTSGEFWLAYGEVKRS